MQSTEDTGYRVRRGLHATPGSDLYCTLPNLGIVRVGGLLELNDLLYAICDNKLYSITSALVISELGTLISSSGAVSMITNGIQLMIVDGVAGYVFDLQTLAFTTITDTNFTNLPAPSYVTYQEGRAIFTLSGGSDSFYISNLNDFTTYDSDGAGPIAFGTAESDPQNLVAPFSVGRKLLLFGRFNTELWVLTDDALFPYRPDPTILIPYGCIAKRSIVEVNGLPIWLSRNKDGHLMLLTVDGNFNPKSLLDDNQVNVLQHLTSYADAYAYSFQLKSHLFYVLTFPTDEKSYIYDVATGSFQQFASWAEDALGNQILGQHLSNSYAFFVGKMIIGDYRGEGNLLYMSFDLPTDYNVSSDDSIYREVTIPVISENKERVTVHNIELDMETATTTVTALESEDEINLPIINIRMSRDGGHSFDQPRTVNFGYAGQYNKRVKLYAWGQFIDGTFKIYTNHTSFIAIHQIIADIELEQDVEYKVKQRST
jgi:hypothetical protein